MSVCVSLSSDPTLVTVSVRDRKCEIDDRGNSRTRYYDRKTSNRNDTNFFRFWILSIGNSINIVQAVP